MASLETPVCNFGWKAVDFDLPGVDGRRYNLASVKGEKGLLVMFICNHCPYVKAVRDRIVRDVNELSRAGIGAIAIMSNDPADYPEDSFDNMAKVARNMAIHSLMFGTKPRKLRKHTGQYVPRISLDSIAKLELQYRGRLDASRKEAAPADVRRDFSKACCRLRKTGHGPQKQIPSIGCSIKWRTE